MQDLPSKPFFNWETLWQHNLGLRYHPTCDMSNMYHNSHGIVVSDVSYRQGANMSQSMPQVYGNFNCKIRVIINSNWRRTTRLILLLGYKNHQYRLVQSWEKKRAWK